MKSCVRGKSSPTRSRIRNSQRHIRASTVWLALHAADCCAWASRTCSCRTSTERNFSSADASWRTCSMPIAHARPGTCTSDVVKRSRSSRAARAPPAQNAIAADHPGLDHAAVAQFDDERDKSGDREIHPFEAFIRPCHHGPVLQFNRYEVWSELIECLRGEAPEHAVFRPRPR